MTTEKEIIKKGKVIVVLPAYNAAATLERTVSEIPRNIVDEIILVDDGSQDETAAIAQKLGLVTYRHQSNRGYGANQKTCYTLALARGGEIVVMLHPDYQYNPRLIKFLVGFIEEGYFDVMLGSRIRTRKEALAGGMPLYKYLANRFLTIIENLVSGYNLSEWHTGMRAYRRVVLEKIDFQKNSDDFVFDTQTLFKIIENGFSIGEIPVAVRYFPEASSTNFIQSVRYGLATLGEAFKHLIKRGRRKC